MLNMNNFFGGTIVLLKFILLGEVSLLASWIKRGILIVMHMEIVIIVGHIRAMSDCLRPVKRRVSTIERLS